MHNGHPSRKSGRAGQAGGAFDASRPRGHGMVRGVGARSPAPFFRVILCFVMTDADKKIEDMSKDEIEDRITEIEGHMSDASFWEDKQRADDAMSELNHLKAQLSKVKSEEVDYDSWSAIMNIMSGAGGTDAEDFVRILCEMYTAYVEEQSWRHQVLHQHETEHGGFKNITLEIDGVGAFGTLKHESGVHRLVRVSPFDADKQRHTSFAMVEVTPKFERPGDVQIPEDEIDIEFSKSGGPGGQNVNKRETAVRMTHTPTGLTVHADGERTQHANRERARQLLAGKLWRKREEERQQAAEDMSVSKTTDAEWGSQIRSYVFHPYQQVKDHRTGVTVQDVEGVLEGNIKPFLKATAEEDIAPDGSDT